ncbi:MAG: hypothetical protein Q7U98_10150 [Methylicorpusculum sp.]|uniref:hypothetical protein n=1 Tax=Methylicorpusculum sp. TaxID=2713644 RepID=UPI0027161504|nr:hypothetical protein [Methylicorpusculum sp.]MDO8939512.1 hypothetical protein [Methylicorpusculum sp.]MDP2178852.1 hypothetical protein [Methylicorpusculum sp.]MDP3529077.1 hypothetical protein [Methylicorpusculum sp.]
MAEIYHWDKYAFVVLAMSQEYLSKNAGVFVFAGEKTQLWSPPSFIPYFIGETNNFQALKTNPLWTTATKMGATHLHTLTVGELERKSIAEKLLKIYNPRLNQLEHFTQPTPMEATMSNDVHISEQLSETKSKLELLYQYEKHYLGLIKEYKEEIKFANTLQEDLRRERTQFFTQTLKDVIQTMNVAQVDNAVSAQWIQELVDSYTKSIDLSGDLAKTHVIEILSILTGESKREATSAQLDNISKKADVK